MRYRFFKIDKQGHLHATPETHELNSDEDALRKAEDLNGRFAIEVWEGPRLIGLVSRKKARLDRNKAESIALSL